MAALSKDQVRHIAKLARLRLTEDEVESFTKELTSILKYVDTLQEVDTTNVQPTSQVTGQNNIFREDSIRMNGTTPDSLLGCSPLSVSDHQIVTPSAHG